MVSAIRRIRSITAVFRAILTPAFAYVSLAATCFLEPASLRSFLFAMSAFPNSQPISSQPCKCEWADCDPYSYSHQHCHRIADVREIEVGSKGSPEQHHKKRTQKETRDHTKHPKETKLAGGYERGHRQPEGYIRKHGGDVTYSLETHIWSNHVPQPHQYERTEKETRDCAKYPEVTQYTLTLGPRHWASGPHCWKGYRRRNSLLLF